MKVYISQVVEFENSNFPYTWRKEYETNVIPHKGDFIEDSIWKNPGAYEVTEVTINYSEDFCYVYVEKYAHKVPESRKADYAKIAESHGWDALWKK